MAHGQGDPVPLELELAGDKSASGKPASRVTGDSVFRGEKKPSEEHSCVCLHLQIGMKSRTVYTIEVQCDQPAAPSTNILRRLQEQRHAPCAWSIHRTTPCLAECQSVCPDQEKKRI